MIQEDYTYTIHEESWPRIQMKKESLDFWMEKLYDRVTRYCKTRLSDNATLDINTIIEEYIKNYLNNDEIHNLVYVFVGKRLFITRNDLIDLFCKSIHERNSMEILLFKNEILKESNLTSDDRIRKEFERNELELWFAGITKNAYEMCLFALERGNCSPIEHLALGIYQRFSTEVKKKIAQYFNIEYNPGNTVTSRRFCQYIRLMNNGRLQHILNIKKEGQKHPIKEPKKTPKGSAWMIFNHNGKK